MAWLLVDVKLKVLIVHQETTTLFKDREVRVILLRQGVKVVTLRQLSFDLDRLAMNVWTSCRMNVTAKIL